MARNRVTPDELLKRNAAWSQETLNIDEGLFTANAAGQNPPVLWIGCSDSRVPESVVCHVKPGDMFVHRNIANQFNEQDDSANSALIYGVEALGVEHIVIVGHTSCGGVLASISGAQGETLPQSEALQRYLTPLVMLCKNIIGSKRAGSDDLLKTVTYENVKRQVHNVVQSKVVQANWSGKRTSFPGSPTAKVQVHGWLHDISNGKLTDLKLTQKAPE